MTLTMRQFLINPTGKGSASVARRDRIRADMEARYKKLYKNARRKFIVRPYIDRTTDNLYFWFKIPSEDYYKEDLVYDVIIHFIPPANYTDETPLDKFSINVFSDSPNFIFTYAYLFNSDDMVINWLKPKLPEKSLKDKPVTRNPDMSYGFEKSIYFSLLYLSDHPELLKSRKLNKLKFNKKQILSSIKTGYQKLEENKQARKKHLESEKNSLKNKTKRIIDQTQRNFSTSKLPSQNHTSKSNVKPKTKNTSNTTSARKPKKKISTTRKVSTLRRK